MKKIKKLILVILVAVLATLGIHTLSKGYYVGQEIGVNYWQYEASKNILCMEHGQNLINTVYYRIISNIKIEGTKSTDHTGKEIDNWNNAKLAGILCSSRPKTDISNAIWNFAYTWMQEVGKNHAGLYGTFASNKKGEVTDLDKEATEYANSIKDQKLQITDKTDKDKVKITAFTQDGETYIQAGPFKWNYEGDLTVAIAYDQNEKVIDELKIGNYQGKDLVWGGKEKIISDKEFYIAVPASKGVTKITKLVGRVTMDIKSVNIWFLEAKSAANQNLIITEPSTDKKRVDTDLPYDINLYIKLSGYVWQDKVDGKQSYRNNLYQDGTDDTQDILMKDIIVRLKNKNGKVIQETKTDNNGAYLFENVPIVYLADYEIEFQYDGLTYQPVEPHLDKENGSKADESTDIRKQFNDNFASIYGTGETTGISQNSTGTKVHDLSYTKDKSAHTTTFVKDSEKYKIMANTTNAGFNIMEHYTGTEEEIKNINLGMYEREQPDLAIMKDLQNAKVSINGYEHTYQYAQRFQNQGEYGDGFNVGVKFGNKYGSMSYTRAIYKSDVEYKPQDAKDELKVYLIYKIQIRNESTNLIGQVNSIIDYYDTRYTIQKIGTGLDDSGNITGSLDSTEAVDYNTDYKKIEINSNLKIEAQKTQDIYVSFELNRDAVLAIMNDKETLDNTVEINSYSSYDEQGVIYAGIDVDSNPGNAIPGDGTTYEDDTDSAPSLKLELTNAREITGKVFLDETNPDLLTAQVREGDGEYKDNEHGISGVQVSMKNTSGEVIQIYDESTKEWKEATNIITDANGDFTIRGYVPGEYILTYTWGDETYTIQNYKGTIYQKRERASNPEWYKEKEPRYSDAMDDWDLRKAIDKQTAAGVSTGETLITKMNSNTPIMKFNMEFESTLTDNSLEYELDEQGNVKKDDNGYVVKKDAFLYRVSNTDFGIAERARQELTIDKHVKTVKVTLADGSILINATINDEGKLEGQIAGLTGGPSLGFIKAEIDNEILQKANIEIEYEITATNISEYDYISEQGDYYLYGKQQAGNNIGEVVKLQVGDVADYLDNTLSFKDTGDDIWKLDETDTTVSGRNAYITKKLSENSLAPTETVTVTISAAKDLANQDEIEFNNLVIVKTLSTVPEFYGPELTPPEDPAEPVTVTTPTGDNQNYIVPVMIGLSTLAILGAGVWFIKKRVLNK